MKHKLGPWTRLLSILVVTACTFLLLQFVSLYLGWQRQALVGVCTVAVGLVLHRVSQAKLLTLMLMLLSLATTLRYGWWRVHMVANFFTDESNHRLSIDAVLMLTLLSAEMYTVFIMVLGYMQTSQTLNRKPVPMPSDEGLWPHVDVLIPTYNEPLSLVRYTALAAINMDYPPEKLHVSILDDGTRPEFRAFCDQAGIGYVVREKHTHAKAGNINHALTTMASPLVAIFDCDHVPTRSFLQCTVGWFLVQDELAMLQTPHFFYSPDPFERNLLQYKDVPNEGELFYGIIQDGNDFWNATFFCGSCAVIRRKALDEVGGIATETVTEDAHTSLRMQKLGWSTAYINIAQAAGLATETLAAHVGQRVRWARGMIQILRTDNPLLGRGMQWSQRLCYFNAMLHFLYAVPRLIFLTAPLAYMLGGFTIIPGYWLAILAYALPHLVLSSLTNSRIQGRHRHSFWNEIYETVLAPYILLPTLLALVNPKLGKFNVTDKGTTLDETVFDRKIAAPTSWLLLLNLIGVLAVPYRLFVLDRQHPAVILSNLVWILFNMVILGVAAAVAHEQKQRRASVRIPAKLALRIVRADGEVLVGETCDMSVGGASATTSIPVELAEGEIVRVSFPQQTGEASVPACSVGGPGQNVRLQFTNMSLAEEETLTRALYSRADSWLHVRHRAEPDRPLLSLARVVRLSFTGFRQVVAGVFPTGKQATKAVLPVAARTAALTLLCLCSALPLVSQAGDRKAPQPSTTVKAEPGAPSILHDDASHPVQSRFTFKDLGVAKTADLHGTHGFYSLHVVLPYTELPRTATLALTYRFSPELRPGSGHLLVRLNNLPVAEVRAASSQGTGNFVEQSISLPPDLLIRENDLTFEFDGQVRPGASPTSALAQLGDSSTIAITADALPFRKDLSLLPLPLFDADLANTSTITFAFLRPPDTTTLRAAGIIASWFGVLSSAKPVRFRTVVGSIPPANAVLFATGLDPLQLPLQRPQGASYQIATNPVQPTTTLLIVSGDTPEELLLAARALSLRPAGHVSLAGVPVVEEGTVARIPSTPLPPPRQPDDAPRWLPTDHLVSLANYSPQPTMRTDGSRPLAVYFRVAPDTYYGEAENLTLHVHYRYNSRSIAPGSALRMVANGEVVNEAPLRTQGGTVDAVRDALLPIANTRPFANTLLFHFDFVPFRRPGMTMQATLRDLQGTILSDTTLDLRDAHHYAAMPNLELFSNAGFPFTRFADLEGTSVVLPARATAAEITLFLQLMSHCGRQTGYPVLRMEVVTPEAMTQPDRDYLVLGTAANQPAFATLEGVLPASITTDGMEVRQETSRRARFSLLWHTLVLRARAMVGIATASQQLTQAQNGPATAVLQGMESPFGSGHSLVAVSLHDDQAEDAFADAFLEVQQSSEIASSVSVLRNGHFTSFAAPGEVYHIGTISRYMVMRVWLAQNFWLLTVGMVAATLVLALGANAFLRRHATRRLAFPLLPDGSPAYRTL